MSQQIHEEIRAGAGPGAHPKALEPRFTLAQCARVSGVYYVVGRSPCWEWTFWCREIKGEMRAALLTVAIMAAIFLVAFEAQATFDCFETPQGQRRCACLGGENCIELQKSGTCKSDFKCDDSEVGAMICSCRAVKVSGKR